MTERPNRVRTASHEIVLRALMAHPRLTRAELASTTGLSKPTAAEAIRRLERTGLVYDTGERTSGRGGVGSYFALSDSAGYALAISVAPEAVIVELVDAAGETRGRATQPIERAASPRTVTRLVTKAVRAAAGPVPTEHIRIAMASAADPVDRQTGLLVHLPDAPFLLGRLSLPRVLATLVGGPVQVDNDVNWAARAEAAVRTATDGTREDGGCQDFVYLYLGEGLGCAVVSDGAVRRGAHGLAGEIAHVLTTGPGDSAMPFTEVFADLGLRHPGSTAIDAAALTEHAGDPAIAATLGTAVSGVLSAAVAYCDPAVIVIGGPWGNTEQILAAVRTEFAATPRPVPVEAARADTEPALLGARAAAVERLRADIVARAR